MHTESETPGAAVSGGSNVPSPAVEEEPAMKGQPEAQPEADDRPLRMRTLDMNQRDRIRDDIVEVMEKTRDALAKALKKPAHRVMSENQIAKLGQTVDCAGWGDTVDDLHHIFPADKVREIGAPVLAAYRSFRSQHILLGDVPLRVTDEEKRALTGDSSEADDEGEDQPTAATTKNKKKPAAKKSAAKPTPKPKKAAATPKPKPAPKAKKSAAKKVVGSKRTRTARSEDDEDDDDDEETTDSSDFTESSSDEEEAAPKPRRGVKAKPKPAPKAKKSTVKKAVGSKRTRTARSEDDEEDETTESSESSESSSEEEAPKRRGVKAKPKPAPKAKTERKLVFDEETSPDEQSSADEDGDTGMGDPREDESDDDEGSSEEDEETSSSEEEDDDSDDSEIARRKRAAKKKKVIEIDESDEDAGNRLGNGRIGGPRRTWNPADRLNDGSRAPKPKPSHVKVKGGEIKPSTKTAFKVKFGSENVPPSRLLADLATERQRVVLQQNKELEGAIFADHRVQVDGTAIHVADFTTTPCWRNAGTYDDFLGVPIPISFDSPEMMRGAQMPGWVNENGVRSAIFFAAMLRHRCPHCKDLPMASPVSNAYETLVHNAVTVGGDFFGWSENVTESASVKAANTFAYGCLPGMGHRRQEYRKVHHDPDFNVEEHPGDADWTKYWKRKRRDSMQSVEWWEKLMADLFPSTHECPLDCRHKDIYTLIDNFAGLTNNLSKLPISVDVPNSLHSVDLRLSLFARSILTTIPRIPKAAENVASRRQAMQAFLNLVADEGQEPQGTDVYSTDNYPMLPEETAATLQEESEGCANHKELLAMCSIEDTGTDGVLPKADTPAGIALQLKPHQQEGVHFMISREATGTRDYVTVDATKVGKFRFYYSPITLRLVMIDMAKVTDEQAMQRLGKKLNPTVRGGILADMMGLGKTLQVFSLMAANPINPAEVTRPLRLPTPESPVKIKATLVVAPVSICRQWMTELKKCFPDAKALLYHGTSRFNFTLEDLAEADMIVTTYETLDKELQNELGQQHSINLIAAARGKYTKDALVAATAIYQKGPYRLERSFNGGVIERGSRDYPSDVISRCDTRVHIRKSDDSDSGISTGPGVYAFFSDLVRDISQSSSPSYKPYRLRDIIFHRVLLDECQKCAGGSFSNLKELQSTYRWVVTGTPINNRYVALAPLFEFLGSSYPRRVFDQDDFARMRYTDSSKIYTPDLSFYLSERRVFADYDNDDYHSGSRPSTTYNNQTLSHRCKLTRYAKPPRWIIAFILQRYMIRHANYSEIMSQVPPVTKVPVYVTMTEVERECYTKIFTRVKDDINTLTRQGRIGDRIGRILMWVDQVRRAAIHPSILLAESLASATANYNASSGTTNENERYNIKQIEAAELKRDLEARNPPAPEACLGSIRRMNGQPPEVDECAVCMQSMVDPVMLPCTHFICRECLLGVIKVKPECPHCRARNMDTKLKYQILLDTSAVELGGQSVQYWQDLIARASEGSKMRAVLNIIGRGSEDDKYVIFSTFPSFIGKMCETLRGHRVNVEVIDGSTTLLRRGKIIEQFQSSDELQPLPSNRDRGPLRVLIISSRCGNAGLTLTAANHLILVEPSLNTTIEDQAMGRLHRIGQHRPVTIHRLVTRHTIEAKIYELSVAGKLVSQGNGGSIATRGENNNSSAAVAQIMDMFNSADDDEQDGD